MAFVEGGNEGALNGITLVDVVVAPVVSTRRLVKKVSFCNRDTVAHTVVVYKDKGGTAYELAREILQPSEYWAFDQLVVLDATNEKLQAKTLAAITTTDLSFDAAYGDAT